MPYYASRLKASSLPAEVTLDLEALSAEANNPHLLSLSKLIARLVREHCAKWVLDNLSERDFPDHGARTTLSQKELEERLYDLFGLVLEMMVSAEFARESVYSLFIIKHMLMKAMPLVQLLSDQAAQDKAHDLNSILWEIHRSICSQEGPGKPFEVESIEAFLLWGEALLKLARSYFVPQGASEIGKTEYFDSLSLAHSKFNKALTLIEKTRKHISIQWRELVQPFAQAKAGSGYVNLLKARASHDEVAKRSFLNDAYSNLKKVEDVRPTINSTYNMACVCALLSRSDETQAWLDLAAQDSSLPSALFIQHDSDLASCRDKAWFKRLLGQSAPASAGSSSIDRSVVLRSSAPPATMIKKDEPRAAKEEDEAQKQGPEVPNTDVEKLKEIITYDEDLNRLQASLMREGFSVATATGMVLEMGKAKHQKMEDDKNIKENRERLIARLAKSGLKEKRHIAGDGNCQFAAVSDQLFDNVNYADYVREEAVKWLRLNKDWELPNGAVLWHFAYDQSWDSLCDELSRRGIWGNHLTLVAMAEKFGLKIRVVSSVKGDNYITEVNPSKLKTTKTAWLSHYAEYHYGSLCPV